VCQVDGLGVRPRLCRIAARYERPGLSLGYHYCLAQPSVQAVLTAPRSLAELEQNLDVLELPAMSKLERGQRQRFGDLAYWEPSALRSDTPRDQRRAAVGALGRLRVPKSGGRDFGLAPSSEPADRCQRGIDEHAR
jgi:hypothetical protein